MIRITIEQDIERCRRLWEEAYPARSVTDLWDVRFCFQRYFRRPPTFIVARDSQQLCGLLPLSWIEEENVYGFFPGETSHGLTWLEQNRIFARDANVLSTLLAHCPGSIHLRYLQPLGLDGVSDPPIDEVNYAFIPSRYDYDMDSYYREFSGKTLKRLRRELAALNQFNPAYRYDDAADFGPMLRLNRDRFGESSYFSDSRFSRSFLELMRLFAKHGWLRMTTILHGDTVVAVDMGCLYNGTYTLLAGGTHGAYPGIAKVINLHHMARACREAYAEVDFLSGSFSWKTLFHLTPRPLYLLSTCSALLRPAEAGMAQPSAASRLELFPEPVASTTPAQAAAPAR